MSSVTNFNYPHLTCCCGAKTILPPSDAHRPVSCNGKCGHRWKAVVCMECKTITPIEQFQSHLDMHREKEAVSHV